MCVCQVSYGFLMASCLDPGPIHTCSLVSKFSFYLPGKFSDDYSTSKIHVQVYLILLTCFQKWRGVTKHWVDWAVAHRQYDHYKDYKDKTNQQKPHLPRQCRTTRSIGHGHDGACGQDGGGVRSLPATKPLPCLISTSAN